MRNDVRRGSIGSRACLLLCLMLPPLFAGGANVSSARSEVRGVVVTVTPLSVTPNAKRWSFQVELDAQTPSLNDNFERDVTLTAADGRLLKPLSWEGGPPGGRHRKVIVHFPPPLPAPQTVELRMHRPDEPLTRVFRFRLQ